MASVIPQDDHAVRAVASIGSIASGYALALTSVAIALGVTLAIRYITVSPTNFAFYAAIFVSTWFLGRGPGWLAAVVSSPATSLALPFLFSGPSYQPAVTPANLTTLAAMLMSAATADLLSTRSHRTEAALRAARDRLEVTVQERTSELKKANDNLREEIAERRRAEAALRTSEEWWRTVFETSNVPIGVTDLAGRSILVNAATEKLLGYSAEELRSITIAELTHEDDRDRTLPSFDDLAGGRRQGYLVEKRYRCKDGSVKWLNATVSRVRDPRSGSDLAVAIVADITEQKRAEQALRASEERWRRVFESSAVAMALADGNRRIIAVNPACQHLLGYAPAEFLQMSALDFKYGDDRAVSARMLDELEQGLRSNFNAEMRFRRKDGEIIWVHASVSYVPPTEITPALFPAVIEDISQRKRAELERERLASIVECSGEMMAICDLQGTPIYLNEAGLRMVGLDDMTRLKSRRGSHFLFREDRPFVADVVWPAIMSNGAWSGELRFRNFKTGQAIPILYSGFRIDDPETGRPVNIGEVARDITDGKQVEMALRASEARWRTVFESASVGVATSDANRRNIVANAALQRMLGFSESEFLSMGWDDLTHADDMMLTTDWVAKLRTAGQQVYPIEKRYLRKDGSYRWYNVNASFIPANEWGPGFFATIVVDIDERRAAEEALRQARAELARVARITTMGALTASIAHEINQPLTGIVASGNACQRWLAREPVNVSRAKDSVSRMVADAERASEVIKRIRSLMTNKASVQVVTAVNDIIEEVLALLRSEFQAKHVTLRTDLGPNLPPIVGDRVQLGQVILNLVMNAIEAMVAVVDHPPVLIVRSELIESSAVRVGIEDSGPGLDPQIQDRIFETFFTTKPDGMGMGLSISTSIVEAHGGRLWAVPAQPRGTIFYFTLPAATRSQS